MASTTRDTTLSPRDGAVIARWAIRYSAGRATGAYQDSSLLAELLVDHLTAPERAAIRVEAQFALELAQRNQNDLVWRNPDEPRVWQDLVGRLDAAEGDGDELPADVGLGRTIALSSVSAMRRASGYDFSHDEAGEDELVRLTAAITNAAHLFSPSDRVLLLRDLHDRHGEMERIGETSPAVWQELYRSVRAMTLDRDYLLRLRLPDAL